MNRRRQVADSNPKNLASTILSHSASASSIGSSTSSTTANGTGELRPTKSIIIGGGQPIVIPGQLNITNDPKMRKQISAAAVMAATPSIRTVADSPTVVPKASTGFIASLFSKNDVQNAIPVPQQSIRMPITEQEVISVEEFCPDGGTLDKGFLEDTPSHQSSNAGNIDQDSDR